MSDIFDQAYLAAQRAAGAELWEAVSDSERLRAIRRQISKMNSKQIAECPLLEDHSIN